MPFIQIQSFCFRQNSSGNSVDLIMVGSENTHYSMDKYFTELYKYLDIWMQEVKAILTIELATLVEFSYQ